MQILQKWGNVINPLVFKDEGKYANTLGGDIYVNTGIIFYRNYIILMKGCCCYEVSNLFL